MGFFGFLLLGLIAGAVAKKIMPGKHDGGWISTLILGAIGAMVGGWLGSALFNHPIDKFFSLSNWVLAIVGSLIVLTVYGFLAGRNKS